MVRCNQNYSKLNYLFTCQDDNLIDRQFSKFQQAFNQELIKSLEIYPFVWRTMWIHDEDLKNSVKRINYK